MWHGRRRTRLSVEQEHRTSLIRNLTKELVVHQRVITTHLRAKAAAQFTEKLITIAKKNSLHSRRRLIAELGTGTEAVAKRLIEVVAPKFSDRKGGYTRILRYKFRQGDGAQLSLLEFTTPVEVIEAKPKKTKKAPAKHVHDHKEHKHEHKEERKPATKEEKKKLTKAEEKKKEETSSEKPKKGGFLKGLRSFLTGKDEQ